MSIQFDNFLNDLSIYDDDRNLICTLHGNASIFSSYAYNIKNKIVATQNEYNEDIIIWDMETGYPIGSIHCNDNTICLEFSTDGNNLISGNDEGFIKIWSMNTLELIKEEKASIDFIYFITYSPNGKYFFTGGHNYVKLWDAKTLELIREFDIENDRIYTIHISPDNRLFATSSWSHNIKIWDIEKGIIVQKIECFYQFIGLKFNSTGSHIATKHLNDTINVWEIGKENYILSFKERKFKKFLKINWAHKKLSIDLEIKNQIYKTLDILPRELIEKIINQVKFRECLLLNDKIIFIKD